MIDNDTRTDASLVKGGNRISCGWGAIVSFRNTERKINGRLLQISAIEDPSPYIPLPFLYTIFIYLSIGQLSNKVHLMKTKKVTGFF